MCKQALLKLTEAGLKLGVNWQKELTELIIDIAARDNLTCLQVIESSEITEILYDEKLSGPLKRARVKKELQKKRYPFYFLAKEEFDRQLRALNLSSEIKVKPAAFFETDKLTIEYDQRLKEDKEIEASLNKLKKANLVKTVIDYVENRA